MGRTSLPAAARRKAGFTLLELVVVLALAGLFLAVVLPTFSGTLESARLRSGTWDVRGTLALARTLAASGARDKSVSFDLSRGEYGVVGGSNVRVLPEGIRFAAVRLGAEEDPVEEGIAQVRFSADGSADDAEIVLASSGGGSLRVVVEPLTGLAEAME